MAKLPYMQFYVNDWVMDCSCLSLSTRGFWLEIICQMHHRDRAGSITATVEQFARMCKCNVEEATAAIKELETCEVATVTRCNENVTITCRRIEKEEIERKRAAEGMKKTREKRKCYGNVTEMLRHNISDTDTENKRDIARDAHARGLSASDAETVEAIVSTYPRVQYRIEAKKAIAENAVADAERQEISVTDALAFMLEQTKTFSATVGSETAFVPDAVKWYNGGGYKTDAAKWREQYCREVKTEVSTRNFRATNPADVGKGWKDNWEGQF